MSKNFIFIHKSKKYFAKMGHFESVPSMPVLALIPARYGSKSIPKKNLVPLRGKPLLAYSIETALNCPDIDRVIVSTDSEEIAKVAKRYGAEVPFLRPEELAQDFTLDLPVFKHCLDFLDQNEHYRPELIVHLRPTTPHRNIKEVSRAIQEIRANDQATSLRSVCLAKQNPFKMWSTSASGFLKPFAQHQTGLSEPYNQPRQLLPEVFWQNGYIDITRYSTLYPTDSSKCSITGDRVLPFFIENLIDIDDFSMLQFAERAMGPSL